jgi:hypothetical protein
VEDAVTNSVDTSEIETSCYVPEESGEFHTPKRLQDVIRRDGNPTKNRQEAFSYNGPFSRPKL